MAYSIINNGDDLDALVAMANWDANRTLILSHPVSYVNDLTASAAEINILDGATLSTAELNKLDGVTASTAEINILDGVTATYTELNYLDITTLGTAQASKAVTADASGDIDLGAGFVSLDKDKLKIDATAMTCTAAELNILDGATLSTAELNYVKDVTSSIQTQLDAKALAANFTGKMTYGTYTGTGASQSISLGWRPDLVFIQLENAGNSFGWYVSENLDGTDGMWPGPTGALTGATYTVTFDTDGFDTTGSVSYTNGKVFHYVAWST